MADPDVVFVVDPPAFHHAFRSWNGIVGQYMVQVLNKGVVLAKKSAPGPGKRPRNRTGINYSTGNLELQIIAGRARWGNELEGRIISLPKYSIFVHEGTAPHVIKPRKPGGHLVFYWGKLGRKVALKHVNHPGTRRIPYLAENLRAMIR